MNIGLKVLATGLALSISAGMSQAANWLGGTSCRVDSTSLVAFSSTEGVKTYSGWTSSPNKGDTIYISMLDTGHSYMSAVYSEYTIDADKLHQGDIDTHSTHWANKETGEYLLGISGDMLEINVNNAGFGINVVVGKTVDGLWKGFYTTFNGLDNGVLVQKLSCTEPWGDTFRKYD